MPRPAYSIQSNVIDISQDVPQRGDIFFVDTNIWYWLTYNPSAAPSNSYANYFSNALTNNATLCYSEILLPELAHIIERNECKIFNQRNRTTFEGKDFRRNHPNERRAIATKVRTAWEQIKRDAQPLHLTLYEALGDQAINRFATQMVDGYDLFILEIMEQEKIIKIITHDSDYVTVPNIQVFTTNTTVLNEAVSQGKLTSR
jgi:predicted nucleic acid-binding protein